MKKFLSNNYVLLSELIVLLVFFIWFSKNFDEEPLIGIIVAFTSILSGVIIKLRKINDIRIEAIEKNKRLRDKFKEELHQPFNPAEPLIGQHRFNCSKVIIHNIDAKNYDNEKPNKYGWYDYFGGEPYRITDEGFDLIIDIVRGEVVENTFYIQEKGKTKYFKHAIVPYSNILNYDFNNDECRPYLYCKYNKVLGPFKEIYYKKIES
jgi:hypothetical protein